MPHTTPPFRADHVGSLLRTVALKEARARRERGEIDADALRAIEDWEIINLIRKQEEVGLRSVTDGEYRRASWQTDFLLGLEGVESYHGERKFKFQGAQPRPILLRLKGKLGGFSGHPMIDHFRFVARHAEATPKMTIPSPSTLHFRYGREAVPEAIYPSMDDFYRDLGTTYRKVVRAFADAGCRYLQLDEVNLAYLCDPALCDQVRARGDDPGTLPFVYADMINAAIADIPPDMVVTMHLCRGNFRSTFVASGGYEPIAEMLFNPPDMVVTMHLCRGNFRSTFVASGGYEPIAEMLFNTIGVHGYFMEFDTARAGGFEPLRFVPKGKKVVLGLVTSKAGVLERRDELKRRIDEAAKFVDVDQLCLSPQCGFASTEDGNVLAEEEQWAKLRMIVEVAQEVWG